MLLKEFIDQLQRIEAESRGTHHFDGKVEVDFCLLNDELDLDIELVPESDDPDDCPVQPYMMLGCGCWAGAKIYLRVKPKP